MIFWDTSALAHLLLDQGRVEEMKQLRGSDPAAGAWWGTTVEASSAIERLKRQQMLSPEEEATAYRKLLRLTLEWVEVAPSEDVREGARKLLTRHAIRSGDALQLAAALTLRMADPDNFRFATTDDQLGLAAMKEGLLLVP